MSLFICQKCNTVENTSLCFPYELVEDKEDPKYPNLHLMDMQGHGDIGEEIKMLCSKCNTGHWHGEFERTQATEAEILMSKIGDFNMITPYDGDSAELFLIDSESPHGYKLHSSAIELLEQLKSIDSTDITEHPLYQIFIEDVRNFSTSCLKHLEMLPHDLTDDVRIRRAAIDSQVYSESSESATFRKMFSMRPRGNSNILLAGLMGIGMLGMMDDLENAYHHNQGIVQPKPNGKETQTEESKYMALSKAEAKRERKRLKKVGIKQ
jgi:hypothetical protein